MEEVKNEVVEYGECQQEKPETACQCTFSQDEQVSVAVKVTPFATPCEAKVTCCGKPMITCCEQHEREKGCCNFIITQKLRTEIPIAFGALVETGIAVVQCDRAETKDCDCEK